jgi:UDP-N-acetyl-D-glucosamine dehydrogenase
MLPLGDWRMGSADNRHMMDHVGVVGLGTVGVLELALWRRAGYPTVGCDTSARRVLAVRAANPTGIDRNHVTSARLRDLDTCEVLILCLPTVTRAGEPSLDAFDRFALELQRLPVRERLIVVASTVPVGFSRRFADRLGSHGALVAHVPERFDPGRATELRAIPRVVGGVNAKARERASALYARAGVLTCSVDPIEVAEASKLLENSFRLVNIAFINEFADLCRVLGIRAADVVDAAATKPFAFMPHYPGPGAGGECVPTMPRYLVEAAAEYRMSLPILTAALRSNRQVANRAAENVTAVLAANGVRRGRVLVVGAAYKPDYSAGRGSTALRFAASLNRHHRVVLLDPVVDASSVPGELELRREVPVGESFDAVVVALRHRGTDDESLRRLSPIFMDLVRGDVQQSTDLWPSRRLGPIGVDESLSEAFQPRVGSSSMLLSSLDKSG